MEGNFPFRVAFVVSCILLAIGYILLQVQLHSSDTIQVQVLPLQLPMASELIDPHKSNEASSAVSHH